MRGIIILGAGTGPENRKAQDETRIKNQEERVGEMKTVFLSDKNGPVAVDAYLTVGLPTGTLCKEGSAKAVAGPSFFGTKWYI